MLVDLTSGSPPTGWQAQPPQTPPVRSVLSAAILAGAFFFCPQTGSVTEQIAAPADGGVVVPTQLVQYTQTVGPLTGRQTPPEINAWYPTFPDRVWYRTLLAAEYQQYVSLPIQPEVTQPLWYPVYPDRIDRLVLLPSAQQAFTGPPYIPGTDLRWQGSWPDRIDRLVVRAADQLAFVSGQTGSVIPYTDLRWAPVYPDILFPPPKLRTDLHQSFALNPLPRPAPAFNVLWYPTFPDQILPAARVPEFPSYVLPTFLPLFDVRWLGTYPDKIWPPSTLAVYLQQAFVLDPFPRPTTLVPLSWLAQYPDFVLRQALLTAAQLAWSSTASTLIWSGPVPTPCPPCPDTGGAGQPDVIIGRGW